MADDLAGIFPTRLSAATLERSPGDLDDVERGTLFVAWPTPPRVGARVQLDLSFGEDAPRRLEAMVVASRPARGPTVAGFKAALLMPHADLLAKLQSLAETARARIVAKAVDLRPAAPDSDAPIRERMTAREATGRQPLLREPTGRQSLLREPTGRYPVDTETTSRHALNGVIKENTARHRPLVEPPPAPAARSPFEGGIDLPEDDGSEFEVDEPVSRTAAQRAHARAENRAPVATNEIELDAGDETLELDRSPFTEREPTPPVTAHGLPPAPSFAFDASVDDDTSDLIASVPVLPPPRAASAPPPPRPVPVPSRPPPVAVRPPPAPIPAPAPQVARTPFVAAPVKVSIANAKTFQIHYQRFLKDGLVYCAQLPAPPLGTTVQVELEIPVEIGNVHAHARVERHVEPPEVPRAGFIARLIDPGGAHAERLADAAILLSV